jgi:hypothetical protein
MKLIFNIENEEISSDELKELLGYLDADISFKNLLPDIITSTKEVKKLIGNEVYNHLSNTYSTNLEEGVFTNDFEDIESNLVRSTRYSIAVKAYSLFAPSNDLSHSTDGRRMRNSDNEKMAFQWMIDADNKEQEKRFYRSLDDLIELLDESKPDDYANLSEDEKENTLYYKWISSSNYKAQKSLFLNSLEAFNQHYIIESRLLFTKLASGIEECERREIFPRLGKEKFLELKEIQSSTTDTKEIELIYQIKKACAFYALAWAIPKMSITLFPEGVLQFQISDRQNTQAKKPPIGNEHEYAVQSFIKSFMFAISDIEALLVPDSEPAVTIPVLRSVFQNDKGFSAT